ncbi:zinc-binding alcohol dehydrogenase family protein [Streptomyces sp. NPDC056773]|uniref:zinc-binding alcohol dehydrogenase family protein n=1 Tax=unclassified Streptomyces TaxID=2593676 RepID=UPI003677A14E
MKAAVVTAAGVSPRYLDFPEPECGPGQHVVELVAAAIHPVVRSKATGAHYSSTGAYPLVPGVDAVARTSEGVLAYVNGPLTPWGTFAQRMAVPVAMTTLLPDGADPVVAAAAMNPGMSSWMPLTTHTAASGTPDCVLVLGPTGAAGGLAVQNARALGVRRVIGAGRGAENLRRVAGLGAETLELTGDLQADVAALATLLGDTAPDLVLDFLWGTAAEVALQALAKVPGESAISYVEIGALAGEYTAVPASLLRSRPLRLTGSGIGSIDPRDYIARGHDYLQLIADKRVTLDAHGFALSDIEDAWSAAGTPRPVLTAC